jgi:hypothetical protein
MKRMAIAAQPSSGTKGSARAGDTRSGTAFLLLYKGVEASLSWK